MDSDNSLIKIRLILPDEKLAFPKITLYPPASQPQFISSILLGQDPLCHFDCIQISLMPSHV